jgi:AmiR/NasT family two-component response regulator
MLRAKPLDRLRQIRLNAPDPLQGLKESGFNLVGLAARLQGVEESDAQQLQLFVITSAQIHSSHHTMPIPANPWRYIVDHHHAIAAALDNDDPDEARKLIEAEADTVAAIVAQRVPPPEPEP